MAKVPFSKLQASVDISEIKNFYCNKAGENVYYEVKHYLPIKEKLDLVSRIINQSLDDNGFYNPMRVKIYTTLEVVYAYTNLNFTDKIKEDPFKLYDILISTGIFNNIVNAICENDWKEIQENVWTTIDNIYKYKNSAMGILSFIASDYDAINLEASNVQRLLTDPDSLNLLKQVVSKLG